MYKVVIVDDEPIIADGLSRSLDWQKWGCDVAAVAYNGEEGLEIVNEVQPDILISDIHMPNMDGLSMIAALRSQFPNMQITILTGYRDFDYAQQAIRLGVHRFLLKPSKMEEIEEALTSMTQQLKRTEKTVGRPKTEKLIKPEESGDEEELIEGAAGSFIVNNALSYIEENYRSKLKLADVAEQVYVSQWHLSKLLNRYTGQSFSDILNNTRIEQAKKLLEDPSLRIGDIADMVGFLDMAHFSRVFKKQTGISANEYRNKINHGIKNGTVL